MQIKLFILHNLFHFLARWVLKGRAIAHCGRVMIPFTGVVFGEVDARITKIALLQVRFFVGFIRDIS